MRVFPEPVFRAAMIFSGGYISDERKRGNTGTDPSSLVGRLHLDNDRE